MRDSLGGLTAIVIIVVFIVVASGYLAFNVNYTKAFRMKDKIIATYDAYDGNCTEDCENEIRAYAQQIGYDSINLTFNCGTNNNSKNEYYCRYVFNKNSNDHISQNNTTEIIDNDGFYYKIVTRINVSIPIIENVFDFHLFEITGDTKVYHKTDTN